MLALLGAIAVTLVAFTLIANCIYLPLMGIAFGGWRNNVIPAVLCGVIAIAIAVAWWFIVGTHIHFEFS